MASPSIRTTVARMPLLLLPLLLAAAAWSPLVAVHAQPPPSPPPLSCAAGFDCVGQQLHTRAAIPCTFPEFAGFQCEGGSNITLCPSGRVCPTALTQVACPDGAFCPQGSSRPFECPVGALCSEGSYKMTYFLFLIIYLVVLFGLILAYYLARRRGRNRVYVAEGFDELRTLGTSKSSAGDDDLPLPMRIKLTVDKVSVQVGDENRGSGAEGTTASAATAANAAASAASVAAAMGKKTLLHNISGTIRGGRLTAIMGCSGAGKTTFLSALLGRVPLSSGSIRINSQYTAAEMSAKNLIAFVPQDDTMLSMLTVRDLLTHSAMTRLPGTMSHAAKRRRVERTIALLGLEHVADRQVGDESERGVSGGEKKRVSIGIELVSEPLLLMLDEPTSGLDSAAALQVCACLRRIASRQMLVASVIHSPRYEIFSQFDDLVLLGKGGHLIYFGPVSSVRAFFAQMGFLVPMHCNPADFFLDVISEPEFVQRFVAGGAAAFMGRGQGGLMGGKTLAVGGSAPSGSDSGSPAPVAQQQHGLRHRQQSSVAGSIVKPLDPALANVDSDADSPVSGGSNDSGPGGAGGADANGGGKKLNVLVELSPLQPFNPPQSPMRQVPTFTALPASSLGGGGGSSKGRPYALRAPSLLGPESSNNGNNGTGTRASPTPIEQPSPSMRGVDPAAAAVGGALTGPHDGTVLAPNSPSPVSSPSPSNSVEVSSSPSPIGVDGGSGGNGAERAPMLRGATTSDACALAARIPASFGWQLWYSLRRNLLQDYRYPRYVLIDSLLQTLPGIALAFPFLGKDMYTPPLPLAVALDCPAMVLDRCLGTTLYSAYFVIPFFFHCMIIGAASQIYAVTSFGRHMAVYRRERGAGLDRVAFFLAKNIYDLLHITRAAWIFIACYFLLNAPVGDLGSWIALLWCMYWAGFGCGYCISWLVRFELAPTIAVCAGICFSVTSGLSPSLDTVAAWGPLRLVWWLSYARWACEAMMLLSSSGQETAGRMDDATEAAAYQPDNVPMDIGMVFLIGVIWRILTAVAMWRKK